MGHLWSTLTLCVVLLGILVEQVKTRGLLIELDRPIEHFAVSHRTMGLTDVMRLFTTLGGTTFLFPLILLSVTYLVFRDRDWRAPVVLASAFATDILLQDVVKKLVDRHRPPLALMIGRYPGGSFPSGHTTQALVVYGMIALLLIRIHPKWPRLWTLAPIATLILLIGASRIYLGAHWFTDVIGGFVLGTFWLATLHALFPFLLRRKPRPGVDDTTWNS
jgi:membrane-associated phospholipid phosphatase